jgi:DNA-binding XRE family transcriptional regulator
MPNGDKSFAQELVAARTGRDLEGLLRELYVEKRHTDQEIANALGVSRTAIRQWRAGFGISRDERPPVVIEGSAA